MRVAGLVLAAGSGRRFGMPKALATFRGRSLIEHATQTLRAGGCAPVLAVVGTARVATEGVRLIENPDRAGGMGSSLRAGLAALGRECAVVVLLVDMPGVTAAAVARLVAAAGPDALARGGYGGRPGHPVLLGRNHWAGAGASARGDRGARDYLRDNACAVIEVGDVADDTDADTPDVLAELERRRA